MPNVSNSIFAGFDIELSQGTFPDGTAQLIGTLTNNPTILLVKNQTNRSVFFADNSGSTKGTTMSPGEVFVLDCRANHGIAQNFSWPIGTSFYATVGSFAGVTGNVRIGVIYAK